MRVQTVDIGLVCMWVQTVDIGLVCMRVQTVDIGVVYMRVQKVELSFVFTRIEKVDRGLVCTRVEMVCSYIYFFKYCLNNLLIITKIRHGSGLHEGPKGLVCTKIQKVDLGLVYTRVQKVYTGMLNSVLFDGWGYSRDKIKCIFDCNCQGTQ